MVTKIGLKCYLFGSLEVIQYLSREPLSYQANERTAHLNLIQKLVLIPTCACTIYWILRTLVLSGARAGGVLPDYCNPPSLVDHSDSKHKHKHHYWHHAYAWRVNWSGCSPILWQALGGCSQMGSIILILLLHSHRAIHWRTYMLLDMFRLFLSWVVLTRFSAMCLGLGYLLETIRES